MLREQFSITMDTAIKEDAMIVARMRGISLALYLERCAINDMAQISPDLMKEMRRVYKLLQKRDAQKKKGVVINKQAERRLAELLEEMNAVLSK